MKAARFDYEKPRALDDAIRLLAGGDGEAKVLAGGQSLTPVLNFRLAQPSLLVDIRGLEELQGISDLGDAISIGAATTHAAIEDGCVPGPVGNMLAAVAHGIAYRAVRNRGTVGGSLAHADPAADWLNVMAVLDAEIVVRGHTGQRVVRGSGLATGPLSTVLAHDEVIVRVGVPKLSARARWSYWKFNRKPGEFAESIGAFVFDPERSLQRGVVGATGSAPCAIADAGAFASSRFDEAAAAAAVTAAGFSPGTYEHQIHLVALRRAHRSLAS